MTESPRRRWGITRWALWAQPGRVISLFLVVECCTVAALSAAAVLGGLGRSSLQLSLALLLVAAGIAHTEVATGVERARRRISERSFTDLSMVWTFAAAVLLPAALAAASIALVYLHLWFRVWKPAQVPLFRHLYTTCSVLLAALAANTVVAVTGGPQTWIVGGAGIAALLAAVVGYALTTYAVAALAVAIGDPQARPADLLGHLDDVTVELATLCLGALLAFALTGSWWYILLVYPPVLVLQRAMLVRELAHAATTDSKTGLLTAAAWDSRATAALARGHRERSDLALLVLDLDHFKRVNDTHGHLAGDRVLAAVAEAVRAEVRGNDLVGRFGGEEFVVMLPGLPGAGAVAELHAVAERIRLRVAGLRVPVETPDGTLTISRLTISVGGTLVHTGSPRTAPSLVTSRAQLEEALALADRALYAAKNSGRNAVRIVGSDPFDQFVEEPVRR